ncbi:MAG: hypothetical protein IMF10_00965 [Proteobacteria bacterium]|nr:hypothetical protein [Pseudomonadota bacterium]
MGKKKAVYDVTLDKRIIEKKILSGKIAEKDLEKYLAGLPDVADNAEEVITEMETEES